MSEYTEQAALFEWATTVEGRIPDLAWLAHWPNGEYRTKATAARLKAAGVRRGPPDIWLPVRRLHYVGFVCELKARRGRLTPDQERWLAHLAAQGWWTGVYHDWTDAARALCTYLGYPFQDLGL